MAVMAYYEDTTPIFLKADTTYTAGQAVTIDSTKAGIIKVASKNDFYGIIAQNVKTKDEFSVKNFQLTHDAVVGDVVGIFFGDAILMTDQIKEAVLVGDSLYVDAGTGKLTKTDPTGGTIVAVAETAGGGSAGSLVRIRLTGKMA